MTEVRSEIVVLKQDEGQLTIAELASLAAVHPSRIAIYVEMGLLEPAASLGTQLLFESNAITRVLAIERMRRDLGVNLPATGIILDLVDRIRALQHEIESLHNRVL